MRKNLRYTPNMRVGGNQSLSGHFKEEKNPWPMPAIEPQLLVQAICSFVTLQKKLFLILSLLSAAPTQVFQFLVDTLESSRVTPNMLHGAVIQQKLPAFNKTQKLMSEWQQVLVTLPYPQPHISRPDNRTLRL